MSKKILGFFIAFLLAIFIFFLFYISTNSHFRRNLLNYPTGLLNFYYKTSVNSATNNKDFKKVSDLINNYIKISQKIYPGKNNKMILSIFKILKDVSENMNTQEDFNKMQDTFLIYSKIDKRNYLNLVWLARAISDENLNLSNEYLKKAINLSPTSEEAYREIIRTHLKKNSELIDLYCNKFFKSIQGGKTNLIYDNVFNGNNSTFGIYLNNEIDEVYKITIQSLNKDKDYKINFKTLKNINNINFIGTFVKGSTLELKEINVYGENKELLEFNNISLISKTGYILDKTNESIIFLNISDQDNIINLYLKDTRNKINSISLNFKISKLPLSTVNCK